MSNITIKMRTAQIKAMHDVIREANDEEIYDSWIYLVPDDPSDEDFEDIAKDDKFYNEVVSLFCKLVAKEGYRV